MRVQFVVEREGLAAFKAVRQTIDNYFLPKVTHEGHPTRTYFGAIDGIPISRSAGFPLVKGPVTDVKAVMSHYVGARNEWMKNALSLILEHEDLQPLSFGGSFFFRVSTGKEIFLEVNFREELDETCADPMAILEFNRPEDFAFSTILMAGQRKLTVNEYRIEDPDCFRLARAVDRALHNQQGRYRWGSEGTPNGQDLRPDLPIRAARLDLALAEEEFQFSQGTLGPKLLQLVEQYLV